MEDGKEGEPSDPPSFNDTDERAEVRFAVRCCGCCVCILIVLWAFGFLFSFYGISTENSMPVYARSWLWLSTSHQLDVFSDASFPPPSPPSFRI
jgi:hypothetical protein